jgi:hypothetical protein
MHGVTHAGHVKVGHALSQEDSCKEENQRSYFGVTQYAIANLGLYAATTRDEVLGWLVTRLRLCFPHSPVLVELDECPGKAYVPPYGWVGLDTSQEALLACMDEEGNLWQLNLNEGEQS